MREAHNTRNRLSILSALEVETNDAVVLFIFSFRQWLDETVPVRDMVSLASSGKILILYKIASSLLSQSSLTTFEGSKVQSSRRKY